jgi:hypothetical protein
LNFLITISLLITLSIITSCKKSDDPVSVKPNIPVQDTNAQGPGGSDAGGGQRQYSTLEQVKAAYHQALEEFKKDFTDSIPYKLEYQLMTIGTKEKLISFRKGMHFLYSPEMIKLLENQKKIDKHNEQLAKINPTNKKFQDIKSSILTLENENKDNNFLINKERPFNQFFDHKRFIILTDRPCLDKYKREKIASVTELNSNGKICLSFDKIADLPPESLKNEIIGLIFHETAHLAGLREVAASKTQFTYLDNAKQITDNYIAKEIEYRKDMSLKIHARVSELRTFTVDAIFQQDREEDLNFFNKFFNFSKNLEGLRNQLYSIKKRKLNPAMHKNFIKHIEEFIKVIDETNRAIEKDVKALEYSEFQPDLSDLTTTLLEKMKLILVIYEKMLPNKSLNIRDLTRYE